MNQKTAVLASCLLLIGVLPDVTAASPPKQAPVEISGERQQWHKITLSVDGPHASEDGNPNPFLDYRMQVEFRHPASGLTYHVPGYFAADGDAANTSATSGNQWRAHLAPDHAGRWTYRISFRQGSGVAISDRPDAGEPVDRVDGLSGEFEVGKTTATGRDFRSRGRLNYVGKHHLQFAGSKEFFLKAGVDAPENLLSYADFDGDFKSDGHKDNLIKNWEPHVRDWRQGDPVWQGDKGKGLIGAINYLASQGLNAFSFLTLNIDGDDRNVFPYTQYDERERMDCSRLDQWEKVFEHGTRMGMHLHFKTQEAENVHLLDDGHLGPERKLYYRELIARFAHHLALNWNLGEEVGLNSNPSTQDKKDWGNYFWSNDPYQHPIVIHNGHKHYDLLGKESPLTGFSLQTNKPDFRFVHPKTKDYIRRSVEAGKPWVVACDEPGDASHSLVPDDEDPTRNNARKNALWGNIMAGGAGVEWYFGYKHAHSDLTCQDFRVRESMWELCEIALQFFANHDIPFWNMVNQNDLVSGADAYCLCDPGSLYLVYRKDSGDVRLDLTGVDSGFDVAWFDPRNGGELQLGSVKSVTGGGQVSLGNAPGNQSEDWLVIVSSNGKRGSVSQSAPTSKTVKLSALNDFEFTPAGDFVTGYKDNARKAMAINAAKHQGVFAAAESQYDGADGTFDVVLTTLTETDGESVYRVRIDGKLVGEVQNPETKKDYGPVHHRFRNVSIQSGDTIRVEFNSDSNGKVPEGDAYAFSRGRWRSIEIVPAGADTTSQHQRTVASSAGNEFVMNYDPAKAKKVHVQTDGIVVVEAEDYDAADRQTHRTWFLTTKDKTPDVKPDPDPSHAEGAVGNAYLELLPDTRVTHADPLVQGVSFAPRGGQCSVLYYPIEFKEPGRYYVWARINCTGSEDNGLHVGIDGRWPESGQRLQFTGHHGKWQWDSRQRTEKVHTGVLGKIWIDVDQPGLHTVMFSMREDGFEFDRFLLTKEQNAMKSKSLEDGPKASPRR
ncbi:DUF5060 domain-containing protein [Rhodopirellula sallentina]|uniref:DUF5060 domain-containing protein n=1 Tax=Rhodopirellula sallentina TaxID=1263869 RepID=UPI00034A4F1C|nr:DUF5060 domain-containing protein [Rhodopirellula sallentina]